MRFDGSFQGQAGAGIGISIGYQGEPAFVKISAPVEVWDATRAEVCGPTLGCIILSTLKKGDLEIEGDNSTVIQCLNFSCEAKEIFMQNSISLCHDMLRGWNYFATWISREYNGECDALARRAVV